MKFIFLLFYLVCVFLLNAAQLEEGWRWKKVFTIQLHEGAKQYPVDQLHSQMSEEVANLHGTFQELVQNPALVIGPIRNFLNSNPSMHDIFAGLNTDDKTIDDVFTHEDPSGHLKAYWLCNSDFSPPPENSEKIINIIRQNLQRLSTRNIVLATIGTTKMGDYLPIPVVDIASSRRVVFLSGKGNRLAELLEDSFFQGFTFVTFDRPYDEKNLYDGFLKGNLGYILSHASPAIPLILKNKSSEYKRELDNYIAALKELQQRRRSYDKKVQALKDVQPTAIEAKPINESILRLSQKTLRDTLRLTIDLEASLTGIQESYQTAQRLIPDFYHSEQLLRLFLYNNLQSLISNHLPLSEIDKFITLHIHSSNDICERCAHCLFLESEMCNVITEESRPTIQKKETKVSDSYGFFEKFFNSVKAIKPDLKYQVLASSSTVGEQRGVRHRYQSGHDLCSSDPIDLSVFPPLLGFKIIPHEFSLQPLTSSLTTSGSSAVLYQTYFPTNVPNV